MKEPEWEEVAESTYRLKIEGGYLYRYQSIYASDIVYVPDISRWIFK